MAESVNNSHAEKKATLLLACALVEALDPHVPDNYELYRKPHSIGYKVVIEGPKGGTGYLRIGIWIQTPQIIFIDTNSMISTRGQPMVLHREAPGIYEDRLGDPARVFWQEPGETVEACAERLATRILGCLLPVQNWAGMGNRSACTKCPLQLRCLTKELLP